MSSVEINMKSQESISVHASASAVTATGAVAAVSPVTTTERAAAAVLAQSAIWDIEKAQRIILECKDRMGSSWCIREMEEQIAQLPAVLDLLKKAGENAPKQLIDDVNRIKTGWLKMAAVLVEVNIVEILRRREKILQYDNLGLSSDFKNECVWRLMAQFPKLEALLKKAEAEATHQLVGRVNEVKASVLKMLVKEPLTVSSYNI